MIKRIKSGGVFEDKIGYCRVVAAGGFAFVSGTVGQGDDVISQCKSALEVIGNALEQAGSDLSRAVRVTYYLPEASDFEKCWPLLRDTFGDNPPAATMIETNLIDPKYKIEIEVTALI